MKKLLYILITIILITGCNIEPRTEYIYTTAPPAVEADPNNLIKLQSNDIVVLDNGMGHMDNWMIPSGMTFEIIIHESEDWLRFYGMPGFTTSSDRIYTVGSGGKHTTDFVALHPTVMMYYFSVEVILDGVSVITDYVIDSN